MSPEKGGVDGPTSVVGMVELFDVTPDGAHRYAGYSDGGHRRVVDGSQLLAQSIVAASKELPDHGVRSAQAVFTRAVDDVRPLWFEVDVTHCGRTFAGAIVTVGQGDRRCAVVSLLLDVVHPDVIRHAAPPPTVGPPADAIEVTMPMDGRELRLVGIGTGQAHKTVSSAVMAIGVTFHEPVAWDGWLLYHHESTQVGAGMSYVRGQVFTERGDLIASFVQEAMLRAFEQDPATHPIPTAARL